MDLFNNKTIKELLSKYEAHPSKTMGQNFLIDELTLDKIIETANLTEKDTILEVGPGIGTLTSELSKKVKMVYAVEKDRAMVEILKETLKDCKNVKIIQDDILKFDGEKYGLESKKYKIVANIPYYLTSPLIRKFLETKNGPTDMTLMIQKEVALRICSNPPRMTLLSVSVQIYAEPQIASFVSKECFLPKPKVDSAILKIISQNFTEKYGQVDIDLFFKIVKAGFSQKRKQLKNNLVSLINDKNKIDLWLLKNKIDPKQRAETLSINDWVNLTSNF